jgi:hypothetical protein
VADLYNQLDKRGQELTAAADLGDQQVIEDEGLLALVDKSLLKLAKRRRELARGAAGGGPPSSMPDDGDGGSRREAQPLQAEVLPADSGGGGNVSLTADQLKDILSALAAGSGKPKLPVPPWPTFLDTYRSFFLFREELGAYIKDYGHGMTERTLAQQIKKNCLSRQSAAYVEWATSPAEILETLAGLFGQPSRLFDSMMTPIRRQKRIGLDDWPALLAYLTVVRNILQEVRRLDQFSLFNNISNVDPFMDKMPTPELERWLELTAGLDDPQQGQALEKFILER